MIDDYTHNPHAAHSAELNMQAGDLANELDEILTRIVKADCDIDFFGRLPHKTIVQMAADLGDILQLTLGAIIANEDRRN